MYVKSDCIFAILISISLGLMVHGFKGSSLGFIVLKVLAFVQFYSQYPNDTWFTRSIYDNLYTNRIKLIC